MYVDDLMIIPELGIMIAIFGALPRMLVTSKPEVLGEVKCQRVMEVDQMPWNAVTRMYSHLANYAHPKATCEE